MQSPELPSDFLNNKIGKAADEELARKNPLDKLSFINSRSATISSLDMPYSFPKCGVAPSFSTILWSMGWCGVKRVFPVSRMQMPDDATILEALLAILHFLESAWSRVLIERAKTSSDFWVANMLNGAAPIILTSKVSGWVGADRCAVRLLEMRPVMTGLLNWEQDFEIWRLVQILE